MNVLIISRGYPTDGDPQFGNFEAEQARALQKAGCNVTVMYVDWRPKSPVKRKCGIIHFKDRGIDVYGIYTVPFPIKRMPSLSILFRTTQIKILYKSAYRNKTHPDIIHAHFLFNLPLAASVGKKYEIPIIETEHWSEIMENSTSCHIAKYSKYYKYAKRIICVSKALKEVLRAKFSIQSDVVYNMIAEDYFMAPIINSSAENKKVELVSVGNLIPRKNFESLLQAIKSLVDEEGGHANIHLNIIGDGILKETLRRKIQMFNIEPYVTIRGRLNKDDIIKILQKADIFILASKQETFGVVYAEALATGLPVVATICGGPEEYIDDSNGILVPVNDDNSLQMALKKMIKQHNQYKKQCIRDAALRLFSPTVVSNQIISIYKQMLS